METAPNPFSNQRRFTYVPDDIWNASPPDVQQWIVENQNAWDERRKSYQQRMDQQTKTFGRILMLTIVAVALPFILILLGIAGLLTF